MIYKQGNSGEKMINLQRLHVMYSIITLLTAILLIRFFMTPTPTEGGHNAFQSFHTGWTVSSGKEVLLKNTTIPFYVGSHFKKAPATLSFTHVLPVQSYNSPLLVLEAYRAYIRIYIDNKKIYEYGFTKQQSITQRIGTGGIFMVSLPPGYEGKRITIELTAPNSKMGMNIDSIIIGDYKEVFYYYLSIHSINIAAFMVLCAIGVLLLCLYIGLFNSKVHYDNILPLACFAFTTGVWLITNSRVIQFLYFNPYFAYLGEYICFYLFIFFLLVYFQMSYDMKQKRLVNIFIRGYFVFFVIAVGSEIIGIAYLFEFLLYYQLLVLCTFVLCIYIVIEEVKRKNRDIYLFSIGIIILIAFGMVDLIRYWLNSYGSASESFTIGIMLFVIVLASDLGRHLIKIEKLHAQNKELKTIAYKDVFTGVWNRDYFDKQMNALSPKALTVVIVMDLNDLKKTNDTYGHSYGDELIKRSAMLFTKVFSKEHVYRIGGDEFVIIKTYESFHELDEDITKLIEWTNEYNRESNLLHISYAYGVAWFNEAFDITLKDTLARADEKMYEHKRQSKEKGDRNQ